MAPMVGLIRRCCPISVDARPGRVVPPSSVAARGLLAPNSLGRRIRSLQPGSRPGAHQGYPVTEDYNGPNQEGFGRSQYTIRDGRRSSSARAFLRPARSRPNLTVLTRANAVRVMMNGNRAVGVVFQQKGKLQEARADREVILSAGTFKTPQLLMLSGIGPAAHLKEIGITPLVDLPVGENLQDHLGVWISYRRRGNGTFHAAMRFDRIATSMIQAYLFGAGPATIVPGGLHAFIKTTPELEVPDIEFMFHTVPVATRIWFPMLRPPYPDGYAIRPTLLRPKSRGHVRLRSANPQDQPRISFNFFDDPTDLPTLREGFKRAQEVGEATAMAPYRTPRPRLARPPAPTRRSMPISNASPRRPIIPPVHAGWARTPVPSSTPNCGYAALTSCGWWTPPRCQTSCLPISTPAS